MFEAGELEAQPARAQASTEELKREAREIMPRGSGKGSAAGWNRRSCPRESESQVLVVGIPEGSGLKTNL